MTASLIEAMDSPKFFKRWFRDPSTWFAWRVVIKVLFGEPLSPEEFDLYREATGRTCLPTWPVVELWLGAGRRGGKSFIIALIAVWVTAQLG